MEDKQGLFVTFEGIDGVGKTTVINLVKDFLKIDYDVVITKEPTDLFYKLNSIINNKESEIFQFWIDRIVNLNQNVKQNLKDNKIVLQDRYYDSTYAYQDQTKMKTSFLDVNYSEIFLEPDITIILEAPIMECMNRIEKNRTVFDSFENEDISIWIQRSVLYKEISSMFPKRDIYYISNENGKLDYCVSTICSLIKEKLNPKIDKEF